MVTVLAFLACIILLPFAAAVVGHIILPALWKLEELSKTTLDPWQAVVGQQYQRYLQKKASK